MLEKILVNIKNINEIEEYKKHQINNFLIPLKNFCMGYSDFSLEEILAIHDEYYLLINRLLTFKDLEHLRNILKEIDNKYLKGIFFEDLGVYTLLNEINFQKEKIYYPNHFATNYESINLFLEHNMDSIVISNEITKEEIEEILANVKKDVIIPVYGYNQIMYSRRTLITNFNNYHHLSLNKENTLTERVTKKNLKIKENDFGTVIYDELYKNLSLLDLTNNIKFYYVNTTFCEVSDVLNDLLNKEQNNKGFLNNKTIYKVSDIRE